MTHQHDSSKGRDSGGAQHTSVLSASLSVSLSCSLALSLSAALIAIQFMLTCAILLTSYFEGLQDSDDPFSARKTTGWFPMTHVQEIDQSPHKIAREAKKRASMQQGASKGKR